MQKKADILFLFCERTIKYISMIPVTLLFVLTLLYQNTISFDVVETSTIIPNGLSFFVAVVLAAVLLYAVYKLLKFVPEKLLFVVLALIYLAVGIYFITHIQMSARHDAGICYSSALSFLEGDFTNIQFGKYLYKYPHQLGLVTYNCLLILISDNEKLVFFANLLWVILTNFFFWRISCLLYKEKPLLRKMIVLLVFCFLPQFFFFFFSYGQVPGMVCLVGAVFFGFKYLEQNNKWDFGFCCLLLALSCLLRKNYLIGGIALIIVFFLKILQEKKWLHFLLVAALAASMILPGKAVSMFYEKVGDTELDKGLPAALHIAMGLQENEDPWRANGWYNGYNEQTYELYNCDPETSADAGMEMIKERLGIFISRPDYGLEFFGEKIITTWCEPTYQSIWSGPLIIFGNETDSPFLENLYSGGSLFRLMSSVMNVLLVLIFMFSLVFVIGKTFAKKTAFGKMELFSLLFFVGGFLFHLAWETKSQYVYPHVLVLIPVACRGMEYGFRFADGLWKRFRNRTKQAAA